MPERGERSPDHTTEQAKGRTQAPMKLGELSHTTGWSHMDSVGKQAKQKSDQEQAPGPAGSTAMSPASCGLVTLWDSGLGQKGQSADPEVTSTRVQLPLDSELHCPGHLGHKDSAHIFGEVTSW